MNARIYLDASRPELVEGAYKATADKQTLTMLTLGCTRQLMRASLRSFARELSMFARTTRIEREESHKLA